MTSIALALFIVFIVYVMIWSIRNDGARSIREQNGYIKMRVPPEKADDNAFRAKAATLGKTVRQPAAGTRASPPDGATLRPGPAPRAGNSSPAAQRPPSQR